MLAAGADLRQQALDALFTPAVGCPGRGSCVAVNTLGAARTAVVELPADLPSPQRSAAGKALAIASAPAMGYALIDPAAVPSAPVTLPRMPPASSSKTAACAPS